MSSLHTMLFWAIHQVVISLLCPLVCPQCEHLLTIPLWAVHQVIIPLLRPSGLPHICISLLCPSGPHHTGISLHALQGSPTCAVLLNKTCAPLQLFPPFPALTTCLYSAFSSECHYEALRFVLFFSMKVTLVCQEASSHPTGPQSHRKGCPSSVILNISP